MKRVNTTVFSLAILAAGQMDRAAFADDAAKLESLNAYDAVREGNRLLEQGNAEGALQAYDHAGKLAPDALEVPFVKGVGNYDLKRFDDARAAFEKAVLSKDRKLATDAQYGIGAAHHAEALALLNSPPAAPDENGAAPAGPKEALQHLESAMQSYRHTLADNPNHAAAREANSKAAHLWKKVKQELQQQQQQQNQDSENKDEKSDEQQQQNQDDDQNQEKQASKEQQENQDSEQKQQQESQQNQSDEQKKDAQEQKSEEQQQKESGEQSEEQKQEEQTAAQQKEQRESQEQANRKLREMMQAVRDRQKARREKIERIPVGPVDKDW